MREPIGGAYTDKFGEGSPACGRMVWWVCAIGTLLLKNRHITRVDNDNTCGVAVSDKVYGIHREHMRYAMDLHPCNQPRVVHLHPSNVALANECSPEVIHYGCIWAQLEKSLDFKEQRFHLVCRQTHAIFVDWSCRHIPQFSCILRREAQDFP